MLIMGATGALAACQMGECPLVHCQDTLVIQWSGMAAGDRGVVVADGVEHRFDCAALAASELRCGERGLILGGRVQQLSVEVSTLTGVRRINTAPQYVDNFPNGTDCPAACTIAWVRVP
ncbi:MAG: hypothetical protein R3A48_21375 [Polyangiales bacterium]